MKPGDTIRQTGNGSQRTRQRRRYLVNPRFQLQYAALVMASVFAVALLVSVVLVGVLNRHVASSLAAIDAGLERPPASNVPLVLCMFSLGLAVMVGFVSLWYTHRISGPIMIMTRCGREALAECVGAPRHTSAHRSTCRIGRPLAPSRAQEAPVYC